MTKSRPPGGRFGRTRLPGSALLAILLAGWAWHARGTGYDGPDDFLAGGKNLAETPEFYWEMEVKRLAKDFHPPEKAALAPREFSDTDGKVDIAPMEKATADADAADFQAALKAGEIKPPDPKAAEQQHAAARKAVTEANEDTTDPLPAEFDSEFADYDRGAFAFRQGQAHWDAARKAWLALLDRPEAERHYRTVWAAFMLGKLALKRGDAAAVKWFEKTRELAARGFADSLGMAADSYGWEGRSEWKQGHPAKAAPLFLTQLALGDESAVVSLKALIPDRDGIYGMLNYDDDAPPPPSDGDASPSPAPGPDQAAAEKKLRADLGARAADPLLRRPDTAHALATGSGGEGWIDAGPKMRADLDAMAADPLLRRLETAHVLATESGGQEWSDSVPASVRSGRWLAVVRAAGLKKVEDAEYLGWLAYTTGDYKAAQHWLDLGNAETPVANWLRSRLELRAGNTKAAAASMAKAWDGLRDPAAYTGWKQPAEGDEGSIYVPEAEDEWTMEQWVGGDMGAVRLLRSDFVQAMDTFLKGDLREDAAYVAERVLTTGELKAYVDKMPPPPPQAKPKDPDAAPYENQDDDTTWMRYLLGRRLVREDRYAEAAPYLPPAYGKLLAKYAQALKNGADGSLSKEVRADNWSTAAWLARNDGMELMGTEVAPDGFDSEGNFENFDLAAERLSGVYLKSIDDKEDTTPLPFPPAKAEIERLKRDPVKPDIRYHYRIIAAALAMRAAGLMKDNTEELADAVNTAGLWVMDRDDKAGNRYYQVIENRCAGTKIGKDAISNHWFVKEQGPWSNALQAQEAALHKAMGIQDQQ